MVFHYKNPTHKPSWDILNCTHLWNTEKKIKKTEYLAQSFHAEGIYEPIFNDILQTNIFF